MRKPVLSGIMLALVSGLGLFGAVYWHKHDFVHGTGVVFCALGVILCAIYLINPERYSWALRLLSALFAVFCVGAIGYDLTADLSLINILLYLLPVELFMLSVTYAVRGNTASLIKLPPFMRIFN